MDSRKNLGYAIIALTLVIAHIILFVPGFLISAEYAIAIDGYVISRNLFILFILYLLSKIGFHLLKKQ